VAWPMGSSNEELVNVCRGVSLYLDCKGRFGSLLLVRLIGWGCTIECTNPG